MKEVFISYIDFAYKNIYQTFFKTIELKNKNFILSKDKKIYVINNGSVDIGVVLIDVKDNDLILNIFQSPNVCRLSILALIESAIHIILTNYSNERYNKVIFSLLNAQAYLFKFKLIFKEYEDTEDLFSVSFNDVLNLKEEDITFRKIKYIEL